MILQAPEPSATKMSLFEALSRLEEISWKLNAKVFGESLEQAARSEQSQPPNKITQALEQIIEITNRLEVVLHGLENL